MPSSEKVVCIVQARMGSSRLRGKVMRPILGMPMIGYTLKRLSKCETITDIILATSVLEDDSVLASYTEELGFKCFRGSEDDVLERYVHANRKYRGDIVIRVTGDCPLIDPDIVDMTVRAYQAQDVDYLHFDISSAARGMDCEVFSAAVLEKTYSIVSKLDDPKNYKEHVTIYIYKHPEQFSIGSVRAETDIGRPYRLCVDEISDFRVIEEIYNHFKNPFPKIKEIVSFLDSNPDVATLNKDVEQKKA